MSTGAPGGHRASGRFELQGEQTLHQGYVMRLVQAAFTSPDGERFERDIVRAPGAVAVVPVQEGAEGPEAVLVRQYRPALDAWLVEIPAGLRDKEGEPPADTASRELAEEAGLAAARYELLTVFVNAAGMSDQRTHIYLASGLSEVPSAADGVEERFLTVERVALAEVPTLVASGVLVDAKTVIGLLLACRRFGI